MTAARWAALAALLFMLYFGVQGGEYGTTDLLSLRRQESGERAQVERLRHVVDSLEREATAIERDADRACGSFLLGRELFESGWKRAFEGEVSGVIGAGAFVRFGGELADVYEGLLPARLLRGERFDLNQTETALVGRRSGRALRLGDPITVRVDSVDPPRGRVDLLPAEDFDG